MAELGTDGPARRLRSLSPAWWSRPPPIPRADRHGPQQGDQAAETKPSAGSCSRIRIIAWGQREPANRRIGRSSDPKDWSRRTL